MPKITLGHREPYTAPTAERVPSGGDPHPPQPARKKTTAKKTAAKKRTTKKG